MTEDQMRNAGEARKVRSIARLKADGVPTIEHLPWIECDPASIRDLEAIARRVMVIGLVAVYAEPNGMPRELLGEFLKARGVEGDLTAKERSFLAKVDPTEQDRSGFTWQYESAHALLWSMGYVDSLGSPTECCTAQGVSATIAPRSLVQLMEESKLRSADEIFDEADLIYRYHWAARNASLRREKPQGGLMTPVCYYRHYALNWLTRSSADWDDVDTST
jgi:hypothetical protein